jgi:hypothetical protein
LYGLAPFIAELGTVREELGKVKAERDRFEREREELRRRAAVAEAELARHRDEKWAPAPPQLPSEAATILVMAETPEAQRPAQGFWQRIRRLFSEE